MSKPDAGLVAVQGLSTHLDAGVLTVVFECGEIDSETVQALQATLQSTICDASIRVLVMCSAVGGLRSAVCGLRSAVCGLRGSMALGACGDLVRLLRSLQQPVVAKLRGVWRGSVLALVGACDIVYVADDAEFALTEASLGSFPDGPLGESISRVMTPRSISLHSLNGRQFDGVEAERNGLATLSFPAAQLDTETDALLASLIEKDPLALRFTKQTLRHVSGMGWDAVLDYNAAKFAEFKSLQEGRPSARAAAVESFLAGTSKPGLGS
jgi:enoyl-CoA hydratase/carnithine racemase